MIKYRLICSNSHEFEGWFGNTAAFDRQAAAHRIGCPVCGSTEVGKAVMAPAVATRRHRTEASNPSAADRIATLLRELRHEVERTAEYVGPRFAEEARRIHYNEANARGIYGEANGTELERLQDEGIEVFHLPHLKEDLN